jgi:hypothetical protein
MTHVKRNVHATHVRSVVRALTMQTWDTRRHAVGGRERHGAVVGGGCAQWGGSLGEVAAIGTASPTRSRGTRGESSSCSGSGFLNGASVVVLVTRQGSATREGLLAVGVGALVRALSRVDATMAGQRTRVTEGLGYVRFTRKTGHDRRTLPHRSHM